MTIPLNEVAQMIPASPWVARFLRHIPAAAEALDFACGSGRHTRLLAAAGHPVLAVDRNASALEPLAAIPGVTTLVADLESGDWPLEGRCFGGIVVTNYLWRPRLPKLIESLAPGSVLIYETFMLGNERYGKPSNPDFLLRPGELRQLADSSGLQVLAYEEGFVNEPRPAVRQAICARQP